MSRWDRLALGAVAAGAVVRAVWVFALHPPFDFVWSDMAGYVGGAMQVASGERLTALTVKAPGTHLLLAIPLKAFGVERPGLWAGAVLWWAMSCMAPLLGWRLAKDLLSEKAAALTAVLIALYPLFITHVGYYSAETPATFLLLSVLLLALKLGKAAGRVALALAPCFGGVVGLLVVARPQLLLNAVVAVAPLLVRFRKRAPVLACVALAAAAVIVPTLVATTRAAGRYVGFGQYDAVNFFVGHCDVTTVYAGGVFAGSRPTALQLGIDRVVHFPDHPMGDKNFYLRRGLECIREDGLGHLALMARNVWDMMGSTIPWPEEDDPAARGVTSLANKAYSFVLPPVVVASLVIWRRERRSGRSTGRGLLLLHLACALPTAWVFFGDPRFRSPYDVFGLALLAAAIADWRMLGRGARTDRDGETRQSREPSEAAT